MNSILSEIFFDSFYTFIFIGNIVALALGVYLLFAPAAALKLNEKVSKRISMRNITKKIEAPIASEPFFYKHSKINGGILVSGSLYILYTLFTFNAYGMIAYLPKSISVEAWIWIIQSIQAFFYISCSFILVFGLFVAIRPSLIKTFEQSANHWVSTRQGFMKMTLNIKFTDDLLAAHPRKFGAIILIFALILLFLLLSNL